MKAKELLVSAGSLLLAGLILVVAGNALAPAAAANAAAEQQEMMETLLPGSTVFTPEEDTGTDANITAVWKGEGGWIIETTVDGYAGPIRQWTGVDSNGHVTGLVVRDMEETFGLGRNALTDIDFLVQFVGTSGEAEVGGGVVETEALDCPDWQGNAVVNYTSAEVPFTRIIEHKHFEFGTQPKTVISREYPVEWADGAEPFYPINNERNNALYGQYKRLAADRTDVIFGGRLGEYRYYDMDKVIAAALSSAENQM